MRECSYINNWRNEPKKPILNPDDYLEIMRDLGECNNNLESRDEILEWINEKRLEPDKP